MGMVDDGNRACGGVVVDVGDGLTKKKRDIVGVDSRGYCCLLYQCLVVLGYSILSFKC